MCVDASDIVSTFVQYLNMNTEWYGFRQEESGKVREKAASEMVFYTWLVRMDTKTTVSDNGVSVNGGMKSFPATHKWVSKRLISRHID